MKILGDLKTRILDELSYTYVTIAELGKKLKTDSKKLFIALRDLEDENLIESRIYKRISGMKRIEKRVRLINLKGEN